MSYKQRSVFLEFLPLKNNNSTFNFVPFFKYEGGCYPHVTFVLEVPTIFSFLKNALPHTRSDFCIVDAFTNIENHLQKQ